METLKIRPNVKIEKQYGISFFIPHQFKRQVSFPVTLPEVFLLYVMVNKLLDYRLNSYESN